MNWYDLIKEELKQAIDHTKEVLRFTEVDTTTLYNDKEEERIYND